MPLYQYKCDSCSEEIEELRSIDDRNNEVFCPVCFSGKLVLELPTTEFRFHGEGTYKKHIKGDY